MRPMPEALAEIIDHGDPPPGHPLYALAMERRAALRELHLLEGYVRALRDARARRVRAAGTPVIEAGRSWR